MRIGTLLAILIATAGIAEAEELVLGEVKYPPGKLPYRLFLPDGIEIDGFAGQRVITWRTSLKAGSNILPLTLIATSPLGGELLATLQHEDECRWNLHRHSTSFFPRQRR